MPRSSPQSKLPHFTLDVQRPLLIIHATDTENSEPPIESMVTTDDGLSRWSRNEPLDSPVSRRWRRKIGDKLVHKFLLMDEEGERSVKFVGVVSFTLTNFPPGYHLFTRYVGSFDSHADKRKDTYISGGNREFRSPNEAMFHMAWLMHGMQPGRCICVYCTQDKSLRRRQGLLNKKFKLAWNEFKINQEKEEREAQQGEGVVPQPPVPLNVFNEQCFLRCD
ncbi:hypothetical protein CPB86DRAFT_698169 [Serendipita vermifera]|nr:hypothetical protein CPB86DRAFT_698169 [Serendipita vermifera]